MKQKCVSVRTINLSKGPAPSSQTQQMQTLWEERKDRARITGKRCQEKQGDDSIILQQDTLLKHPQLKELN